MPYLLLTKFALLKKNDQRNNFARKIKFKLKIVIYRCVIVVYFLIIESSYTCF